MQIGLNGVVGCDEAANAAENTLDNEAASVKFHSRFVLGRVARGESAPTEMENGAGDSQNRQIDGADTYYSGFMMG